MNLLKTGRLISFALLLLIFGSSRLVYSITPEEIVNIREIADPQISPDGQWIVFVTKEPADPTKRESKRNSDIWIVSTTDNKSEEKYIFGPDKEFSPRWSPDGKYLAYLSNSGDDGTVQIYLINRTDSKIIKITNVKNGVNGFKWFHGSKDIAFTSTVAIGKKSILSDAYELSDNPAISRLFRINLESSEITPISDITDNVNDFDISPDGKRIAMCTSSTSKWDDISCHSKLIVVSLNGSGRKMIANIAGDLIMSVNLGNVRWSPDTKHILYFTRIGKVFTMLPAIISPDGSKKTILGKSYKDTIWDMQWLNSGSILVSSQEGVQGIIDKLDIRTNSVEKIANVGCAWDWPNNWSTDKTGKLIAFKDAKSNAPEDIWIMNADGSGKKQLTNMNPQASSLKFGEEQTVRWSSYDGTPI
jgi:Tol biopolymer transport system component